MYKLCNTDKNSCVWSWLKWSYLGSSTCTNTCSHTNTYYSTHSTNQVLYLFMFLRAAWWRLTQRPLDGTFKRPAAKSRRLFVSESLAHNHTYPQTDTDKYPGISVDIYFLYLCCKCFSWCTGSYRSLTAVLKGLYFCSIYCHLHSNKKNTGERG